MRKVLCAIALVVCMGVLSGCHSPFTCEKKDSTVASAPKELKKEVKKEVKKPCCCCDCVKPVVK